MTLVLNRSEDVQYDERDAAVMINEKANTAGCPKFEKQYSYWESENLWLTVAPGAGQEQLTRLRDFIRWYLVDAPRMAEAWQEG